MKKWQVEIHTIAIPTPQIWGVGTDLVGSGYGENSRPELVTG